MLRPILFQLRETIGEYGMEKDRESRRHKTYRTLFLVFCIAACKELFFWLFPDELVLNTAVKLVAGAAVILVSCGLRYRPSSAEEKAIITAVFLYILADLVMRWIFLLSGALFLAGHLIVIFCLTRKKKPSRKGLVVWAVQTGIETPFLICLFQKNGLSLAAGLAGALYGSVLVLMTVCAADHVKILAAAVILFVCSDFLLALFKLSSSLRWIHTPSILLFYLSIGLFLIYCRDYAQRDGNTDMDLQESMKE